MTRSSRNVRKTYLRMVQSVQIIDRLSKLSRVENPPITFSKEVARQLHPPHDDALVITLSVADYTTPRMLVDNRSSADILYYPIFNQMRIDNKWLLPLNMPLIGFGKTKVFPSSQSRCQSPLTATRSSSQGRSHFWSSTSLQLTMPSLDDLRSKHGKRPPPPTIYLSSSRRNIGQEKRIGIRWQHTNATQPCQKWMIIY